MERRKERSEMSGCRHSRKTVICPGVAWCVKCGAYRMTWMAMRKDGWRSIWGKWHKPTGA